MIESPNDGNSVKLTKSMEKGSFGTNGDKVYKQNGDFTPNPLEIPPISPLEHGNTGTNGPKRDLEAMLFLRNGAKDGFATRLELVVLGKKGVWRGQWASLS